MLPQGHDGGTVACMGALSDLERALLAIAARPHPGDGEQMRRARAELGLTATRYYQLPNERTVGRTGFSAGYTSIIMQ